MNNAKFVFDETINWTLGGDSGSGTFKLVDTPRTGFTFEYRWNKTTKRQFVFRYRCRIISVTNPTNYEEKIFTYAGGVITDSGGGVVVDDDNIPNTKAPS